MWNYMVFNSLSKSECEHWINNWIHDKLLIMGLINDFFPNYCALVIIYIYWVFGNQNNVNDVSDIVDTTTNDDSALGKSLSRD